MRPIAPPPGMTGARLEAFGLALATMTGARAMADLRDRAQERGNTWAEVTR